MGICRELIDDETRIQRQEYLNKYFSSRILKVFSAGIQEADWDVVENKISCAEAVEVLRHTMRIIENNIPLQF